MVQWGRAKLDPREGPVAVLIDFVEEVLAHAPQALLLLAVREDELPECVHLRFWESLRSNCIISIQENRVIGDLPSLCTQARDATKSIRHDVIASHRIAT